jgi:DNA polymerase V
MEQNLLQCPGALALEPPSHDLRMLARIHAGFPSPATDYIEEGLDLNDYLIDHPAATFLFTVQGDSMKDAGIMNGDRVIVDRSKTAHHNDIVIAEIDGEYTIKRLFRRGGQVELRPDNADYPAITLKEGNELRAWGVVVGVVRRYASLARG